VTSSLRSLAGCPRICETAPKRARSLQSGLRLRSLSGENIKPEIDNRSSTKVINETIIRVLACALKPTVVLQARRMRRDKRFAGRAAAMRTLRGKKALVTGAASGIGSAIALALAQEGIDLYLVDIDKAKLATTAHEAKGFGVRVVTRSCDLAQSDEINAMVDALLSQWGTLDLLVNNAGIAYYGPTHGMTAEQWDRILSINLLAPIQLVRKLLPTLLARDDPHILNVCSIFGLVPMRKGAAYQTSKFGLVGLSAALRAEYDSEIGVTALCPGFVRTPMLETFDIGPEQRRHRIPGWLCASPKAIGAAAIHALRRNKGIVVVTPIAQLYWLLSRLFPGVVDWLARRAWRRRQQVDER